MREELQGREGGCHGLDLFLSPVAGKSASAVWQDHVQDRHGLRTYSSAMKRLATGPWAGREDGGRIEWCVATCQEYFSSRLEQLLLKDLRRMDHSMPTCVPSSLLPHSPEEVRAVVSAVQGGKRWRLLDVGSCYNPFLDWPQFEVTAVDIAPATEVSGTLSPNHPPPYLLLLSSPSLIPECV